MPPSMLQQAPSREALRILSQLCRGQRAQSRQYCSIQTLSRRRVTASTPCTSQRHTLLSSIRTKTTIVDAPEPQTFANDPSKYNPQDRNAPEPSAQGTTDPQHEASAAPLPDITDYYTLFPQTLPGGPPRPQSSIPDASTITSDTPSTTSSAESTSTPTPTFTLNPRELRKEFLALQSIYHPDKFPAGSVAHSRAYALSTLLNNAYKTLSDPLLRAQYLLQLLYDIDVTNEDNSAHPSDTDTLMVVMEAQEELEEADGDGGKEVVERLMEENRARIRETEQELGNAFESGDVDRARNETVRLKYWRSLEGGLRDWEPGKEVRLTH